VIQGNGSSKFSSCEEKAGFGVKYCVAPKTRLTTVPSLLLTLWHSILFQMGVQKASRQRIGAGALLFLVVGALAVALFARQTPWHDAVGQASYDWLHRLAGEKPLANSSVVIVYLDLASYKSRGLDPLKPWPRELHSQLLHRLTAEGARAVVFDIVFSGASANSTADEALASAIRENARVILASECEYDASHATSDWQVGARSHSITPPFQAFANGAASIGMAIQTVDDDYTVRRYIAGFSESEPTLTWAAAFWLRLPMTQQTEAMQRANKNWIRYYGPPLSIPHVSYNEALDPTGVPTNFFRDKIVFVGARPWVEQFHERQDEFRSPFRSWANKELFTPGVEVHATELLDLLQSDCLLRLEARSELGWLLVCAALFGGGLVWFRPLPATCIALLGVCSVPFVSSLAFSRGVWFPWLLISAVEIPAAWAGSILFNSIEWYVVRKRLEAAKRIADAKIREQAALIEKAHDAILVQGLDGSILYANPSAERLYGWSATELQSQGNASEIFLPDVEISKAAREAVSKQGEWNGEVRQQTRDGRIVTVANHWTLIRDEDGAPKAFLIIGIDVTEQKQLEAQLLRTQRMNMIGTIAGGMAHDLNNALAPILMGVQLLRRKAGDSETRNLLQLMEASTHRGADMVRQVLLFARGRSGGFERLELSPLIQELEKMVRETFPKNIAVDSFLPADLWPVEGNPTQLHQILLNLCVNARDAMPNGGKLSFAADHGQVSASEAATIPGARTGEFVSILVSDTGTGMPAEMRARIFEPFFTTKEEGRGTGIGLSTVMRLVKAHQGFLRVESEPGQGTTFEIFLPRGRDSKPFSKEAPLELAPGNGETILVADDEQAIRDLLATELTSSGYRVLSAANGAEAVALFREHANQVRLFITDGAMPVLDGCGAIAAMRNIKPDLPVILTSGNAEKNDTLRICVVNKPFSLEDILASIQQEMVNQRSAHS